MVAGTGASTAATVGAAPGTSGDQHQHHHEQQQQPQTQPQTQPPRQPISRYRSLRGKSISTPRLRTFDVYNDLPDSPDTDDGGGAESDPERGSPSVRRRRRGRSVNPPAAPTSKSKSYLNLPLPTFALAPKTVNHSSNIKTLDYLNKPPPLPPLPHEVVRQAALNKRAFEKQVEASAAAAVAARADRDENDHDYHADNLIQARSHFIPNANDTTVFASEIARLDAETDRILAEQKKLDLARLQRELAAAKTPPPKAKRLLLGIGKLPFLTRSKRSDAGSSPGTPSTFAPTVFSIDYSRGDNTSVETTPLSTPSPDRMNFIEVGGKGIVPQTDAPTSASNAGERRVTVRVLTSVINLPVTNDTSPPDIIYSSANFTTHQIDPASCVVTESYGDLGLERRLRRYERIRDVMNSWDRDQQNTLVISTIDDAEDVSGLEMASVPRSTDGPPGFTMHVYHSTRLGKWNKRWVTLGENGQIFACKKPDGKPSDKDTTALCHLSDFDIYLPRDSVMARTLKPPKRHCYAIKSQQKTAVFADNSLNFLHFFSIEDSKQAKRFYDAVHEWRSWYLVNKQVDLLKKDRAPQSPPRARTNGLTRSNTTKTMGSTDAVPYTIGEFQPLMDLSQFDKPLDDFSKAFEEEAKAVQERFREEQRQVAQRQLSSRPTKPNPRPQQPALPLLSKDPGEFAASGLLGNAYEKRKKAHATTTPTTPMDDGPFTDGPSLLSRAASKASSPAKPAVESWFPSASDHTARSRPTTADNSRGRKQPQQPLLNLESEQRRRPSTKRGGQGVRAPANGEPLINLATGGQPTNVFESGGLLAGPRMPRSNTGGMRMPLPPSPMSSRPTSSGNGGGGSSGGGRPRSRSTSQTLLRTRPLLDDQPPVPPLPHRSGRREGMPHNGPPRGPSVPSEPLVYRAR